MSNQLRAYFDRAGEGASDTGPIRFVASTEGVKRDGLDLSMSQWDLVNYRKNPVVLWGHDYWGTRAPIGRADVEIQGDKLMADVTFDQDDEFAASIDRKYRNRFLHSVSVGWDTIIPPGKHMHEVTKDQIRLDLLDISAVPVPGDPDALMERQIRAIQKLDTILTEISDAPDEPRGIEAQVQWEGTALRMVRLFLAGIDDEFDDRAYRRIEREYRRLGKTAPDVPEHLAALDLDTLRGLFLEGEPELVPELFQPVAATPDPDDFLERLAASFT